ncbi:hypothetical protein CB0940_09941 [Cercospora beticola]|uniref:Uncharacterized protein n=1 Tax=Cercospora beticola TaxID=122368 RepID=A0A2G5HG60_CERBT|nr:hypothetical protein CB0940_09941 [Cercospora beticola]PIA91485.1 hypothetical protein CB0940_09941 [Cercospora beticola]WPB05709.1 hypothetical protein RHO25_010363 [Cercospora beticola]
MAALIESWFFYQSNSEHYPGVVALSMRLLTALTAFIAALGVSAQQPAVECVQEGQALIVTRDCIDPEYASPTFTNQANETQPVPHERISGYFNGTAVNFTIYLTPKSQWKGRFFQLVYPSQNASAPDYAISFGVESGGFTVQTSGSIGYRADAATAKLARGIAQDYYNVSADEVYGYVYGGSGGSLEVVGAAEKTFGVWDGCLVLIQATPISIPYNWGMRAFGGLIFGNKSAQIIDAVQPGSNVDLTSVFDNLEQAVLEEVTALGVPLKGWEDWDAIVGNRTQLFQTMKDITIPMIQDMDPTYADDFWTKDGYAGAEQSALGKRFRTALVEFNSTIASTAVGDHGMTTEFVLEDVPENIAGSVGLGFSIMVNNTLQPFSGHLDSDTRTVYISSRGATNEKLQALVPGARVVVDNRWYLAAHTFYRHQVPPKESGFYAFDYLRDDAGQPLYPQRSILIGPLITQSTTGGATHTGNITMKAIALQNLLDFDAFPWHADWYSKQVAKAKGGIEDHYRLYFGENADHAMYRLGAPFTKRLVDWTGLYEQHLQDLSAWVEYGIEPPTPTNYTVEDGQVRIPSAASERKGIQPLVELLVNGTKRAEVKSGGRIEFNVEAEVPTGLDQIVALEWDAYGTGEYAKKDLEVSQALSVQFSHVYEEPGLYFAGVRVASHREGNTRTDIALAWNMDRVRVIVS